MKSELHPTKNDLPKTSHGTMVTLLNQVLADVLDLKLQVKQAHWNVKGPNFIALHELFDKVAEELEEHSDDLAERAVQLGGTARGTVQAIVKQSRLKPYPVEIASGKDHVGALSNALAHFGTSTCAAIDQATTAGDADTADLFTGVSRGVDKLLWLVEAHTQATD